MTSIELFGHKDVSQTIQLLVQNNLMRLDVQSMMILDMSTQKLHLWGNVTCEPAK
jgi:hypothetical protein